MNLLRFFVPIEKSSIGIIGGADGPTAILVAGNITTQILTLVAAVTAIGLAVFAIIRAVKKHKSKQ